MRQNFYTSAEAASITGCTRRQLQYWREKAVVVPIVNASGKGHSVYYSESDLIALTVMEYLLSLGLSFEVSKATLEILRQREAWIFESSLTPDQMKRFMLLTGDPQNLVNLTDFDKKKALKFIESGFPVIPFWSDTIHTRLQVHLDRFQQKPLFDSKNQHFLVDGEQVAVLEEKVVVGRKRTIDD